MDRTPPRPPLAIWPADERVEVAVQHRCGLFTHTNDAGLRLGLDLGDHRDALVDRRFDDHPSANQPSPVERVEDAGHRLLAGHEVLEADLTIDDRGGGHDQDPHAAGIGAVACGQALDAGNLGRRGARELLEVFGGHGPVAGAQQDGPASLGRLEVFAVDATSGRSAVLHAGDERDRRLQCLDRAGADVADPASAGRVGLQLHDRALRCDGAVLAHRTVGLAHPGAERDHAVHGVEHEDAIVGRATGEMLGLVPFRLAVFGGDQQPQEIAGRQHRCVRGLERLAGHALRHSQRLVFDDVGVGRIGGAPDGVGDEAVDHRGGAVRGLPLDGGCHSGAQPSGAFTVEQCGRMLSGHVHGDRAVAVQSAGGVFADLAGVPVGAVVGLPLQRRIVGVNTHALDGAVELQSNGAPRHGVGEADQQCIARHRWRGERGEWNSQPKLFGAGLATVGGRARSQHGIERAGDDRQVLDRREHDRLFRLGPQRCCARATRQRQRGLRGRRQVERHAGARRGGREQLQADQFEELQVQPIRHAVEPVQQDIGHVGERFDQGHARVRHVVVGPRGAAGLNHPLGVVDQLLEASIVEIWCWQCHQ